MHKISADLHTHTIASGHAADTIRTMCEHACRQGLEGIAITDHGPGIEAGAREIYFLALKRLIRNIDLPIRIIRGVEDDIKNKNGELHLSHRALSDMEIVLVGCHPFTWMAGQTTTVQTEAVVNCIINGYARVYTHPVNHYYKVDLGPVMDACLSHNAALEFNTSKLHPHKTMTGFLNECAKNSVPIVVNSDAHVAEEVGRFDKAVQMLEEVEFPEHLVVNRSKQAIASFFGFEWYKKPVSQPRSEK
ncbi:MAG: PHP domain-containing protein [Spirochaetota bacterium]